jgi:hypothetical protein
MAYLGNGIYDLLNVARASANPQINYEGLYQDPMPNELTRNFFKAMTPDYSLNTLLPRYFEKNADMASPSGKFYDDLTLRGEFRRVNQGLPLFNRYYDIDRVGRFEDFNPRVGIINAGVPIDNLYQTVGDPFQTDYPITRAIKQEDEEEEDQMIEEIMAPYTGVTGLGYQTPRTIADQNRVLGQTFTKQKPSGIARLFEVLGNIPTPMNILRGGLESLQGFNQRIRSTPFARSKTLAEYFDRRSRAKMAEKMAEKYQDFSEKTSGAGATGGEGGFSTPAGKSTSYEQASRGFAASRK